MAKRKLKPNLDIEVKCVACGVAQSIGNFRVAALSPLKYIDFCKTCEEKHGTLKLYKLYPLVDDEVRSRVFVAARKQPRARSEDEVRLLVEPKTKKFVDEVTPIKPHELSEHAKRELAQRELCRRHLIPFVMRFKPDYDAAWVHHDIARRLEKFLDDVINGLSPRLAFYLPPRTGKSVLTSDNFISWAIGKYPWLEFILGSHSVELPRGFSRDIRDRMRSAEYAELFPEAVMRADTQSVDLWKTTKGGQFIAAGVGTGITGKGAHIGIIDDPIKDDAEAQSPGVRETTWNWYAVTFLSRIAPGGGVLLINTRWHDDDVSGRIERMMSEAREAGVPDEEVDQFEIVCYPALAEGDEYLFPDGDVVTSPPEIPDGARLLRKTGDAIHPARYSRTAFMRLKNGMPSSRWNAVYQQNPVPDDGEEFKREYFPFETPLSSDQLSQMTIIMAGDLAQGLLKVNDYSVGVVGALDTNDILHVLHVTRGRFKTGPLVSMLVDLLQTYKVDKYGMEVDRPWMVLKPLVDAEIARRRIAPSYYDKMVPVNDKKVRAMTLQSRAQLGKIRFPAGAPWADKAMGELLRFPAGVHDDIVDALAWLAKLALHVGPPQHRRPATAPKSWMDELSVPSPRHYMAI